MNSTQDNSKLATRNARVWLALDKLGALGAMLSAIAAPCCFPIFAAAAGWVGLGSIPLLRGNAPFFIQSMTILAFIGQVAAYRQHRRRGPLFVCTVSASLVTVAYYVHFHVALVYLALAGLGIAAVWNYSASRRARSGCCSTKQPAVTLESVLTCPNCGRQSLETMPTYACVYFHDCPACGTRLKPKPGDCCVFCSYGSVKCPPIQVGTSCALTPRTPV